MSKRKFQDEDDVFDDNAPIPSSSNNGRHSRKTSDVVDNGRGFEIIVQPDPSTPVRAKSAHPNLVSQDEGGKDTPDRAAGVIPELLLRRVDQVDATPTPPQWVENEYKENENLESTPHGIEVTMPVTRDAEVYNMGHPKRGTCLVFNHQIFEEEKSNRDGSNVDVDRIEATFGRLGFDVVVHDNLTYVDVMDKINNLSKLDNHTNNDCVCVFVLTHGQENDLLRAKDAAYRSDKIWKPFTADNCPTLAGKPKLFFLQACRGEKFDAGVRMRTPSKYRDQTDHATTASYTIPTLSDFLIAHSCSDGFYSWRNPQNGTWFVQSLCDVLDKFAESTDLLKMLTMTARKVATNFESYDDENSQKHKQKQIPSTTSTLTRDLYFMPK